MDVFVLVLEDLQAFMKSIEEALRVEVLVFLFRFAVEDWMALAISRHTTD